MSNLPFLLSISVHKQWKASAKQRQLQEEVRQPHLCDSLWSEHCLGQCVAAERGQSLVPCGHGWVAVLDQPQHHCRCGFRGKKRWAPLNMQRFCLPLSIGKAVRISPAPLLPIALLLIQDLTQAHGAEKQLQGTGQQKWAWAQPSLSWAERSWKEQGGAVSSTSTGNCCTELSPVSEVVVQCGEDNHTFILSGVCLSLFSAVSGSGTERVLWWVTATCLCLGTATWCLA